MGRAKKPESMVRPACRQCELRIGKSTAHLARRLAPIEAAARDAADLAALPERCSTGHAG